MKKNIVKIVIFLVFAGIGYLGYAVVEKITHKKNIEKQLKELPSFSLITTDSIAFSSKQLKTHKPVIILYFNSECHYCQEEATQISSLKKEFGQAELLFISRENTEKIENFAKTYNLDTDDNIHFLHDPGNAFSTKFDINTIPFTMVYDTNKTLIAKYKGAIKATTLLEDITLADPLK
jgi:peroxiredoxin